MPRTSRWGDGRCSPDEVEAVQVVLHPHVEGRGDGACDRCKRGSCRPAAAAVLPPAPAILGTDASPRVRAMAVELAGARAHCCPPAAGAPAHRCRPPGAGRGRQGARPASSLAVVLDEPRCLNASRLPGFPASALRPAGEWCLHRAGAGCTGPGTADVRGQRRGRGRAAMRGIMPCAG